MTTYADYLKKGNKVDPKLLASKQAKPPVASRPKDNKDPFILSVYQMHKQRVKSKVQQSA